MSLTANEYAAALRMIADHYEANPEMPIGIGPSIFAWDRETFLKAVEYLSKGGMVHKTVDPETSYSPQFRATRKFGEFEFTVQIDRKLVCRLVRAAEYECPDSLLEEAKEYADT